MSAITVDPCNDKNHVLHVWTDKAGHRWACCAYDHGPMCRRCQSIDDAVSEALIENVVLGNLQIWDHDIEGWQFKVTEQGSAEAQELVESNPEARRLYETVMLEESFKASPSTEGESS